MWSFIPSLDLPYPCGQAKDFDSLSGLKDFIRSLHDDKGCRARDLACGWVLHSVNLPSGRGFCSVYHFEAFGRGRYQKECLIR